MKHIMTRVLFVALVAGLSAYAVASQHTETGTWTGIVTDTGCGGKGASASHADCAVKCVKEKGAKFALYTPADKGLWVLSNQNEAERMAGKDVTVKGTLDKEKKVIEVSSMEPAAR